MNKYMGSSVSEFVRTECGGDEDTWPDPPENEDFLDLPEAFQDKVAARFEAGIQKTQFANDCAASILEGTRYVAIERQRAREAVERERATERLARAQARETARRANKASIGEFQSRRNGR